MNTQLFEQLPESIMEQQSTNKTVIESIEYNGKSYYCLQRDIKPSIEGFKEGTSFLAVHDLATVKILGYGKTVKGDWGVFQCGNKTALIASHLFDTDKEALAKYEELYKNFDSTDYIEI